MLKRIGPIIAALLFLTAGLLLQQRLAPPRQEAPVLLPAASLTDLDGHPRSLSAWQGKVVLINFWASWCQPCREEIPLLNQLQQQYGGQGLQLVGIAIDEEEAVRQFHAALPLAYPSLLAPDQGIPLMEHLGNRFGVLPYTVIADRDGKVVFRHPGAVTLQQVQTALEPLLGASTPAAGQ